MGRTRPLTPRAARQDEFDELYRTTFSSVYAYCLRRVEPRGDVEDVVAEVYATVWRRLDDALGADKPLAWIFGVASNTITNHRRGHGRSARLTNRLGQARRVQPPDPSTTVVQSEALDTAAAALASLSPIDRELVRLAVWEELSYAEIADVLDLNPATIRSRLYRARQRFAHELEGSAGDNTRDETPEPDTNRADEPPEIAPEADDDPFEPEGGSQ